VTTVPKHVPTLAASAKRQELQSAQPGSLRTEQFAEYERLLALCEVQAVRSGVPFPLGAHVRANGVNFAIFSRNATGVRLDLFDQPGAAMPVRSIILDAVRNKTGDIWHVWLEGIGPGLLYGSDAFSSVASRGRYGSALTP